jgi:hypothetical protein
VPTKAEKQTLLYNIPLHSFTQHTGWRLKNKILKNYLVGKTYGMMGHSTFTETCCTFPLSE